MVNRSHEKQYKTILRLDRIARLIDRTCEYVLLSNIQEKKKNEGQQIKRRLRFFFIYFLFSLSFETNRC